MGGCRYANRLQIRLQLLEAFLIDVADDELHAFSGKRKRGGAADAASGSSDDRDSAGQVLPPWPGAAPGVQPADAGEWSELDVIVISAGPDEEVETLFNGDGITPTDDDVIYTVSAGSH